MVSMMSASGGSVELDNDTIGEDESLLKPQRMLKKHKTNKFNQNSKEADSDSRNATNDSYN